MRLTVVFVKYFVCACNTVFFNTIKCFLFDITDGPYGASKSELLVRDAALYKYHTRYTLYTGVTRECVGLIKKIKALSCELSMSNQKKKTKTTRYISSLVRDMVYIGRDVFAGFRPQNKYFQLLLFGRCISRNIIYNLFRVECLGCLLFRYRSVLHDKPTIFSLHCV